MTTCVPPHTPDHTYMFERPTSWCRHSLIRVVKFVSTRFAIRLNAGGSLNRSNWTVGHVRSAEALRKSAQSLALKDKATLKWYAIKIGPGKFGIFDTFANEAGRNAQSTGQIAKALTARAGELFAVPAQVAKVEVLANTPARD